MLAGQLTDELDDKLHKLYEKLTLVHDKPSNSTWIQEFQQLKKEVSIYQKIHQSANKLTIESYDELIQAHKTRNKLEIQYEKALDGSDKKHFYEEQLLIMNDVIANSQILVKNQKKEDELTKIRIAHERELGVIRSDKADKTRIAETTKLLNLYKQYGKVSAKLDFAQGTNEKNEMQDQVSAIEKMIKQQMRIVGIEEFDIWDNPEVAKSWQSGYKEIENA
jgi:hypothetical protein